MSLEAEIADTAGDVGTVNIGGRPLSLTNLGKVLWPDVGFTKREMLTYYASVADALVPHLHDRPVTFKRAPDGVDAPWWYQTQCPHPPEWMRTQPVPAAGTDRHGTTA
jgi:bifunctional non-homologous end joining protein LigD